MTPACGCRPDLARDSRATPPLVLELAYLRSFELPVSIQAFRYRYVTGGAELYEKLPLMGGLMRWLKKRAAR